MTMRIDRDSRVYIYWDAELDVDPTGSEVTLEVDNQAYPMEWQGGAIRTGRQTWKQTAKTTSLFIGIDKTVVGTDVQLPSGKHVGKPIVTFPDGQSVPCYPAVTITAD